MAGRGVSPIVSVLLIIVITVAVSVFVYLWVTGYQASIEEEAGGRTNLGACLNFIGVEVAYEDSSSISYKIWLMNCGETRLHVDYVYLLDPSGKVTYTYYAGDWAIEPGVQNYLWVWIPKSYLRDGEVSYVRVTTKEGLEVTTSFRVKFSV